MKETIPEYHEDHDMAGPQEPVETLHENNSHKRKPTWEHDLLQDLERYGTLDGMHSERKIPYNGYVSLLGDIIEKEPSNYKE